MAVQFEAVCGPKFMTFWGDVGDPLLLSTHLTICLCHVSFRRHRPLKLPLSCEVVEKGGLQGTCRGRDTPDFGHTFSNRSYFRPCGQFWLSFVQRARRLGGEKRRRKSLVKYRSADNYVGWPNKTKHKKLSGKETRIECARRITGTKITTSVSGSTGNHCLFHCLPSPNIFKSNFYGTDTWYIQKFFLFMQSSRRTSMIRYCQMLTRPDL